jgi:hypothetical protein
VKVGPKEALAYPDNRHLFDMVLEALRLLAGKLFHHGSEQSKIAEIQNTMVY